MSAGQYHIGAVDDAGDLYADDSIYTAASAMPYPLAPQATQLTAELRRWVAMGGYGFVWVTHAFCVDFCDDASRYTWGEGTYGKLGHGDNKSELSPKCVQVVGRACTDAAHARTRARTHARTHVHTHTQAHARACTRAHARTHVHACIHACKHACTHACTDAWMHGCTDARTRTRTRTCTRTRTRPPARPHARMHARAHTHTYTHIPR